MQRFGFWKEEVRNTWLRARTKAGLFAREISRRHRIFLQMMELMTSELNWMSCWMMADRPGASELSWEGNQLRLLDILGRRTIWNSRSIKNGKWVTILLDQLALRPQNLIITTFWIYLKPFTVQKLTLSREKKGGSTASQKLTSLVLQWAVPSVCSFVRVWDSSGFQNRRRNGGGDDLEW